MGWTLSYCIVGDASCTHFARCTRLAVLLRTAFNLNERDVRVESKHPDAWQAALKNICLVGAESCIRFVPVHVLTVAHITCSLGYFVF